MPRPRSIIPTVSLHTKIRQDLHTRLTLHLWSTVEGRVPQGAYAAWIENQIRKELEQRNVQS